MRKRIVRKRIKHPDVAGNARAALARAKVFVVDLSRTYGGSLAYWYRRLNGETPMSVDDLYVIADAAGVPASSLVADKDALTPHQPQPQKGYAYSPISHETFAPWAACDYNASNPSVKGDIK